MGSGNSAILTVTVDVDESPPEADHDLGADEDCDVPGGLELDMSRAFSTDPDSDIDVEFWWVDDDPCNMGCVVPLGTHTVSLEASDERGAIDRTPDLDVTVNATPSCPT